MSIQIATPTPTTSWRPFPGGVAGLGVFERGA
jgi:hypothetical protein